MSVTAAPLTSHLSTVAADYDVLLSDVWGVVHNGVIATASACDALHRFRAQGGTVVLITNAPRPGAFVQRFMDGVQVPRDAYDAIVSSGDVTRALILARAGQRVAHIGPSRDEPIFDGVGSLLAPVESADYVVCSGLRDDTKEGPDDYDDILAAMLARRLPMICANPDVVVGRGDHLVYCAGALADRYAAKGGEVIYAGKPYRPIYEQAMTAAHDVRGQKTAPDRVLAIGDSVRTDLKGAATFGIDSIFVIGGIHAEEIGSQHNPDALATMFKSAQVTPKLVMQQLAW